MDKFKKNLFKNETDKKQKSTISFEETLERLNKKKSKDLTVNDLQHEINIVKQEKSELKHNNKSDNNHIKPKMIMLKVGKSNSEHDEHNDGMNPINRLFFLIKVFLILSLILNLLLLIKFFLQNGLQKLKLLFLLIIISLLLL